MSSLSFFQRMRISTEVRKDWYQAFSSMTASRIPVIDALKDMSVEFRAIDHPMSPLVDELLLRMRGGRAGTGKAGSLRLGSSLKGLVPPNEALMVEAGEETGNVSRGLHQAGEFVGATQGLINEVRGAMMVPLLYVAMMFTMFGFFAIDLLPQLELTSKRAMWPKSAQMFGVVADHIIWIAIGFVVLAFLLWMGFKYACDYWVGARREYADQKIWPFTMVALMNSSALLTGLSGFILAGVPFENAISKMADSSNFYMRHKYGQIRYTLKNGKADYIALLSCQLIPRRQAWMISLYGRTIDFGSSLEGISKGFVKFATQRTKVISRAVSLVCNCLIGVVISWTVQVVFGIVMSVK